MTTALQPVHALVPGANLEAYVHAVNSIPLLTVEQVSKTLDEIRAGPPTRASPPPIRGQVPISTTRHHNGDQPL